MRREYASLLSFGKIDRFICREDDASKGPDYFVAAARKVLEQEKNIVFVMAGDGDMYHAVIEQAARLGLAEHFLFTGFYAEEN